MVFRESGAPSYTDQLLKPIGVNNNALMETESNVQKVVLDEMSKEATRGVEINCCDEHLYD